MSSARGRKIKASIDITPDAGYRIATITDNGAVQPIVDPYVIDNVTASHAVVVTFAQNNFTVDASVQGGHGLVSPPTQTVGGGGTAAVNITPDPGYEIATISDNGAEVPVSNPYVIQHVGANHTVVVTFGVREFDVNAAVAGGHGTVTPATQNVEYGATASIDITPEAGYHIASIVDNSTSMPVADPYVIDNVTAAHDVVVSFELNQYAVTATVVGGNGTATPATQTVAHDGTASITITPSPSFHIATITDNGVPQAVGSPYVITHVVADHNVVVTFAGSAYMVAATVAGGSGTALPATQQVSPGSSADVNITPSPGWHTLSITDNGVPMPIVNPYHIATVNEDHSVVVVFAHDTYTINASVDGPGGTVDPASQSIAMGGTGAVTIHPDAGHHIESITDNGAFVLPISNPYVINSISADHIVVVVFDNDEQTVTATVAGPGGTVTPPSQLVDYGESASIDVHPDAGYHLSGIVDNGTPVALADPYVINGVIIDHTVTFAFTQDSFTVDASVSGNGGTVAPVTQTVMGGDSAVINIVPDDGYHIENITDNGAFVPIANPYVMSQVSADHDVIVGFSINEYTAKAAVAGGNGTVDPHEQSVAHGDTAVIDLEPDSGYLPNIIIDNGDRKEPQNPYFIPDMTTNHNVTVAFAYEQSPTFYLAEGSTAWGFSTYLSIENPNAQVLTGRITYMLTNGQEKTLDVTLPALSQTTVNPAATLGEADFSTKVMCLEGKTIAVDRTMTWTGPGAPSPEAHSSVGVSAPANTWYLPEGSSAFGFETWTLVENPGDTAADVTLTYMIEGVGPKAVEKTVAAHTRATYSMVADIGSVNASVEVDSSVPVVAERSMYRNNRREGSTSIGTEVPSTSFYLAEGSTAWGFTTFVLVQNLNDVAANVTLTCMTTAGPKQLAPFTMAPGTRRTVPMNALIPDTDFSTKVTSNQPVVAERAMYWGSGTALGEACHDSIGLDEPHAVFYLPDGQTSEGRETFTLVANPNSSAVQVMISYLFSDGTGASYIIATVPANSRATFNMATQLPSGRASISVNCLTSGKKILAERAMYWNGRGVGTDTVGDWSH